MNHTVKLSISIIVIVALAALYIQWEVRREAVFTAAMQDYEKCMNERAGMTPSEYYYRFGYYPECY